MKKKLLCTMMAVVMSVMMVTGCGSSAEETTEEAAVEETAEEAEEAQAAAEELGMTVEVITASTSNDIPQVISTAAINYYELGKQTAEMAVRVLEGESASAVVVETQKECALVVNKTFAESVGVEIPAEMLEIAATVY